MDLTTFTAQGNWLATGARYALHTAAEGLVETAYHICARRFSFAPADARSAFRRLAGAGLLSPEFLCRMQALVGVRNVLVDGYDRVDDAQIYAMIRDQLDDFDAVLAALEAAATDGDPPSASSPPSTTDEN